MRSILSYWQFDPVMVVFLIILCMIYFYLTGYKWIKRSVYFLTGMVLILLSVASPLHFLGENYLMSAHMAAHVLLLLIASPLLVLGLPESGRHKLLDRFSVILLKYLWLPWMIGVSVMWFWHIPWIFNKLMETPDQMNMSDSFHIKGILQTIQWMSLIIAGIIFSWPVIGPVRSRRAAPLNAVLYLSAACIFCSLLGLLITFSPFGVYTPYMNIQDRYGFLNMIRNQNGISVIVDQQMAGLIMWVPGCLIYLSASMYLLMHWFRRKNEHTVLAKHQETR